MIKNRLDHPDDFIETILLNWVNPENKEFLEALKLAKELQGYVKNRNANEISIWIKSINDPELLGSAFYILYNFAIDYRDKLLNIK